MAFWNKSEIVCAFSLMSLIVTVGVSEANFVMAAASPVICAGDGTMFYPIEKRLVIDNQEITLDPSRAHGLFPDALSMKLKGQNATLSLEPVGEADGSGKYTLRIGTMTRTLVCSGYEH
jgi:hypothetical protein